MNLKDRLVALGFDSDWATTILREHGDEIGMIVFNLVTGGFSAEWVKATLTTLGPVFLKVVVAWVSSGKLFRATPDGPACDADRNKAFVEACSQALGVCR